MGFYDPLGFALDGFSRLCDMWAMALRAGCSSCAACAGAPQDPHFLSLEQGLETVERFYAAVVPRIAELSMVEKLAPSLEKDEDFQKQWSLFKESLQTSLGHLAGLPRGDFCFEKALGLLGQSPDRLTPEDRETRHCYEQGWHKVYSLERQWFELLCTLSTPVLHGPGKEDPRTVALWAGALERFFRPEERKGVEFIIPDQRNLEILELRDRGALHPSCARLEDAINAKQSRWESTRESLPLALEHA